MAEETLKLNRRTPDEARLKWAHELVAQVGDRLPRGWSEVYAFEQLRLHEDPTAELKLQAIRIGDFGITAIPDEVYGITGIKLKNRSPLAVDDEYRTRQWRGRLHSSAGTASSSADIRHGLRAQRGWKCRQSHRSWRC